MKEVHYKGIENTKINPERELEILFHYKGNIELFNRVKKYIVENSEFDKYEFKKGVTQEQVINIVALEHLNKIIFPILEAVYIFQDKPFKCLSWIKGTLKQYEYAEFLKLLVLDGLKDRKRFETVSNNLEYIIQEVSEYDFSNLTKEPNITCGMFEYFTGEKTYSDIELTLKAFTAVRGWQKTKHDIVKDFIKDYRKEIIEQLNKENVSLKALPPQQSEEHEQNKKLIIFKNSETINKIYSELKGYFPNKEAELLKALQGEQLSRKILFPHNQNKFVEVFRRLKYNGFILNTDTEIKNWICTNFEYAKKMQPQPFNENTIWNNLNKGIGEPTKKERICFENVDWLPYKSPKQLKEAAQKEKL